MSEFHVREWSHLPMFNMVVRDERGVVAGAVLSGGGLGPRRVRRRRRRRWGGAAGDPSTQPPVGWVTAAQLAILVNRTEWAVLQQLRAIAHREDRDEYKNERQWRALLRPRPGPYRGPGVDEGPRIAADAQRLRTMALW